MRGPLLYVESKVDFGEGVKTWPLYAKHACVHKLKCDQRHEMLALVLVQLKTLGQQWSQEVTVHLIIQEDQICPIGCEKWHGNGMVRSINWSVKRDSNPRPSAWEADALAN